MHIKENIMIATILALSVFTLSTGSAAKAFAQADVDFATNVEFIRGHLEKAVFNKGAGNNTLATAHAGHPVGEVYSLITTDIKAKNPELDSKLRTDLTDLFGQIETLNLAEVESRVATMNADLDTAVEAVVPASDRNDPAYWAKVIISLFETAKGEYELGVVDGAVAQQIEYQDAIAFINRAKTVFANIKAETPAEEAGEIDDSFTQLGTLVAKPASSNEVQAVLDGTSKELQEAFKLESSEASNLGGWEYIAQTGELLDQSVEQYQAGNFDEARALAARAYIDNFEFIEPDIAEDNKTLMGKIETAMRIDLVKMMDDRKPVGDIQTQVNQIKVDLETAKAVVTPEFPVAALAASLGIAGMIAYTRLRSFRRV